MATAQSERAELRVIDAVADTIDTMNGASALRLRRALLAADGGRRGAYLVLASAAACRCEAERNRLAGRIESALVWEREMDWHLDVAPTVATLT